MVSPPQLNVRMRRVCLELRRMRRAANLTLKQVASRVGHTSSMLSKLESRGVGLNRQLLIELMIVCQVADPEVRNAMLKLYDNADQAGMLDRGAVLVNEDAENWAGFEAHATTIRNYQQMLVPGLLQTFPYAHALIERAGPQLSQQEIEDRTTARIARQALLRQRTKPVLQLILHEAALREVVGGPEVMSAQLVHLAEMNTRWDITVRVVPFGVGAHPGMIGQFVMLDYDLLPSLVLIEHATSDLYLEEDADVDAYNSAWQGIEAVALTPMDSVELIQGIAAGLK